MPINNLHLPSETQQALLIRELARFAPIKGALNLEQLDGYFTALHLSPKEYDIADWLSPIWGGGDLPVGGLFYSPDDIQQFFTTLIQHWKNVDARLTKDEIFMPLAFLERPDASYWAQGFLIGTQLYENDWQLYCLDDQEGLEAALLAQAYLHHSDEQLKTYGGNSEENRRKYLEYKGALNQQLIVALNQFKS